MNREKFGVLFLCLMISSTIFAAMGEKPLDGGVRFGFGMPKTPYRYRMPFSVTGGLVLNYHLNEKIKFQADANTLTTFNLGTVDGNDSDLKFNLNWIGLSGMVKMRGKFSVGSYLSLGMGYYQLNQQFDNNTDKLNTYGISLGISNDNAMRKIKTVMDLRWHLLFEPDPQPQLLTIMIGFLL